MDQLLAQIATIIQDYRAGDLPPRSADHVCRWINQFDAAVRIPILEEMVHVLNKSYLTNANCRKFIKMVATNAKFAGPNPADFWRKIQFLRVQQGGRSQADMLALFQEELAQQFGIRALPEARSDTMIYVDDASFSGNRVLSDLRPWIANTAPAAGEVHIVVMALHSGGEYYASTNLKKAATAANKNLTFKWWRAVSFEDRRSYTTTSDVLRPTVIPQQPNVLAYVAAMQHQPSLRTAGQIGSAQLFSSDGRRQLLEQEFLKVGCHIRQICPNLPQQHRPLGYSVLETLGFGTMLVTYRNCPNNAPLALWVGDPWIPLFPRRNN